MRTRPPGTAENRSWETPGDGNLSETTTCYCVWFCVHQKRYCINCTQQCDRIERDIKLLPVNLLTINIIYVYTIAVYDRVEERLHHYKVCYVGCYIGIHLFFCAKHNAFAPPIIIMTGKAVVFTWLATS